MISPEVPLPKIPGSEANRQSITQAKAGPDLLAASRRRDFNTLSPSSIFLSLPHGEKPNNKSPPVAASTVSTQLGLPSTLASVRAAPGRARHTLPACVYSSRRSSPPSLFPWQASHLAPFHHNSTEVTASPLPSLSCAPAQASPSRAPVTCRPGK